MMRAGLTVAGRQIAATLRHLASQIVVSVVTAVSVAFITNAYLTGETRSGPHAHQIAVSEAAQADQAAAIGPAGSAGARPVGSRQDGRPALPKLEAVYVPTVPATPAVVADLSPVPSRVGVEDIGPAPAVLVPPEEPRRRLFGIPLPRPLADLGAVRDRMAGLLRGETPNSPGLR